MISHRITSADLVKLTGYSRHKLRSLLAELPGFGEARGARVAREYSVQEMTVIAVCCGLEEQCGLRRDVIAELVLEMRKVLTLPREPNSDLRLVVSIRPVTVSCLREGDSAATGTILALSPILDSIDEYLMIDRGTSQEKQRSLEFAPHSIGRHSLKRAPKVTIQDVTSTQKKHGTG